MSTRHWVVIPAAGLGQRMASAIPKQYLPLAGRTVIEWSLAPFLGRSEFPSIVVVLAAGDPHWSALPLASNKHVITLVGGAERADSVRAGVAVIAEHAKAEDWVLVHDAARPFLDSADLDRLLKALAEDPVGGLLAAPVPDTLKRAGHDNRVEATVSRSQLWRALTPQMFRFGLLRQALEQCVAGDASITDEAAAVESLGLKPLLVPGRSDNIKITTLEDLTLAERFFASRHDG